MTSRLPILLVALVALAVPTVGTTAPGDRPGIERRGGFEARRQRAADNEQAFLDGLALKDAERHRKVVEIRSARPLMYRQLLRQVGQDLRMRNQDPEAWARVGQMIDLTYTLHGHLDDWESADEKGRRKLQPTIEQDVARIFEARQAHRRAQLALMEQRLQRLRGEIEQRDARKDEIVGEFTERMLSALERRAP